MNKLKRYIKRLFDIIASLALILVLAPLFLALSLLIWFGIGRPILFTQERLGYQGKPFNLYKFRTMTMEQDAAGNLLPDGERMTKLGKFLRSTSLDELPELINVLLGDMSAIGPRPLLPEYKDLYTDEQWRRHEMPQGMAGPVVASGRNALSWEEKFQQDVWYVDNWSLYLDAKILLKTIISVIKRDGISAKGHVTMTSFEGTERETFHEKD